MDFALLVLGLGFLAGFGTFSLLSIREGEPRAARVALGAGVVASLPFFLSPLLPGAIKLILLGFVALAAIVGAVLFLLPVGRVECGLDVPRRRYDERDIMFARARLVPGSSDFEAYYALRPENKAGDDKTRSLPGLLSIEASEANPLVFASTSASFSLTEAVRDAVDGRITPRRMQIEPAPMSAYLKALARYHGAHSVGITKLQPYHVYSHIGRGSGEYGAPIVLHHRYAIAFATEMEHALVRTAPAAPITLESARQYVEGAKIAIQLANLIRSLGFPSRAHIDGNYRVIAPLVARDAGLGEIGRMGLLMTPALGPRVRLGVVTTDLPLVADQRDDDTSMIDFCRFCLKCASNCPVRAIPMGDREEIDGALRWRINADVCFRYWNVLGTDCGRCMAVCPYSYPDSAMHNMVRWAVRRSGVARRVAYWLDGIFYGSEPPSKPPPGWLPPKESADELSHRH